MPRLKGIKNKKKRSPRLKLPQSTLATVNRLSEDACLPFLKVLDDAVLEGCAELRTEVYDKYIEFNSRLRGKVVRERELTQTSQQVEVAASPQDAGADQDGLVNAGLERGYVPENPQDTGLAPGEGEPVQLQPSQQEFREAAIATAEHLVNHPPFSLEGFSIPSDGTQEGETETESVG